MRKLLFLALIGFLCFSGIASANYLFTLDDQDLMGLTTHQATPFSSLMTVTDDQALYNSTATSPMGGTVGFIGMIFGSTGNAGEILIGNTGSDLAGFDEFALTFTNDNDDIWNVRLFVDTGSGIIYSDLFAIVPTQTMTLSMSLPNLGTVQSVGFAVSAEILDIFHISASSVPEPATLIILAAGSLIALRKRRS